MLLNYVDKPIPLEKFYNILILTKEETRIRYISNFTGEGIIDFSEKKKYVNTLKNSDIVLSNFPINTEKENFRYDLIQNILFGNDSIFLTKLFNYESNSLKVFMSKLVIEKILNNKEILGYRSFLLNHLSKGSVAKTLKIQGKIKLSKYGRWYWSDQIQNNKDIRENYIDELIELGNQVIAIDIISATPTLMATLSGSTQIKKLIKNRIKIYNEEVSQSIKKFLNVSIHSGIINIPEYQQKTILSVAPSFSFNLYKKELSDYYNKVLIQYRKRDCIKELNRRKIINTSGLSDLEIIKTHNVYLQGNAHDAILDLSSILYKKFNILPYLTIHDCIYYSVSKDFDSSKIKESLRKIGLPLTIRIYS